MNITKINAKGTVKIDLRIENEINKKLLDKAKSLNISRSDLIRKYIEKGLEQEGYTGEQEEIFIRNLKTALNEVLKPHVERICAISAKSGIASASAYFLSATTFNAFVHPSMKSEFTDAINDAKKMGIAFMRTKDVSIDDIMDDGVSRLKNKYLSK